jgi:hypothetical protein
MKSALINSNKKTTGLGEIAKLLAGIFLVICLLHH